MSPTKPKTNGNRTEEVHDQNPETQLMRLGAFVQAHPDGVITREYVDIASANDTRHCTA